MPATLEFFSADWFDIPSVAREVRLRIVANPPVAAGAGIVGFARRLATDAEPQPAWARLPWNGVIDNVPQSAEPPVVHLALRRGLEYVLRFQGQAHLLMPGFAEIECGFVLEDDSGLPLENFGGSRKVQNVRAAAINGQTFFRQR